MLTPHLLSGPEMTALLAAMGLILNATIMFFIVFINAKKRSKRIVAKNGMRTYTIGKERL